MFRRAAPAIPPAAAASNVMPAQASPAASAIVEDFQIVDRKLSYDNAPEPAQQQGEEIKATASKVEHDDVKVVSVNQVGDMDFVLGSVFPPRLERATNESLFADEPRHQVFEDALAQSDAHSEATQLSFNPSDADLDDYDDAGLMDRLLHPSPRTPIRVETVSSFDDDVDSGGLTSAPHGANVVPNDIPVVVEPLRQETTAAVVPETIRDDDRQTMQHPILSGHFLLREGQEQGRARQGQQAIEMDNVDDIVGVNERRERWTRYRRYTTVLAVIILCCCLFYGSFFEQEAYATETPKPVVLTEQIKVLGVKSIGASLRKATETIHVDGVPTLSVDETPAFSLFKDDAPIILRAVESMEAANGNSLGMPFMSLTEETTITLDESTPTVAPATEDGTAPDASSGPLLKAFYSIPKFLRQFEFGMIPAFAVQERPLAMTGLVYGALLAIAVFFSCKMCRGNNNNNTGAPEFVARHGRQDLSKLMVQWQHGLQRHGRRCRAGKGKTLAFDPHNFEMLTKDDLEQVLLEGFNYRAPSSATKAELMYKAIDKYTSALKAMGVDAIRQVLEINGIHVPDDMKKDKLILLALETGF